MFENNCNKDCEKDKYPRVIYSFGPTGPTGPTGPQGLEGTTGPTGTYPNIYKKLL